MNTFLVISTLLLWATVVVLGFLLLGTLRSLGLLQWRFDALESTRPVRKGREGLPPGKRAPEFTLPAASGGEVSLQEFAGRRLLLVFTQSGCGPCHTIAPELNRLHDEGEYRILVVNNGEPDSTSEWAREVKARFPVVTQADWSLSKRYQVFATPYGFVVDEQGVIAAKGVVSSPQYIRFLFDAAEEHVLKAYESPERDSVDDRDSSTTVSLKEMIHA